MDNSIKKFKCEKCHNICNSIIWKSINKLDIYMCEMCWKKYDIQLKIDVLEKLIKSKI